MNADRILQSLVEPTLAFGYGQHMEHPKDGLLLYGPYSNPFLGGKLRIGLISTPEGATRYATWVRQISRAIYPKKAGDPNHTVFPGFQAVFQTEWPEVPTAKLVLDATELNHAICMEDRYQAIYKAVSLYADSIVSFIREQSETSIDLWMSVVPEEIYRLGRPKSKVTKEERQQSEILMDKKAATRIFRQPSLFDDDNKNAEIYLYELNFHNQLKARLLRHKVVIQVVRDTTLAPGDFEKSNGMPLRQLQDPATLAWNLATTAFFKAGGQPWKLSTPRPGVCYVGIVFKKEALGADENNACCGAQMFLDSGDGVVFRGAVGPWYSPSNKQFHLTREKARDLMNLIVGSYRRLHDGQSPTELFIHGKTWFSAEEWDGFRETVPENCKVVCVRIQEDSSLKLFRRGQTNIPRGFAWAMSEKKGYLWSKGFIPRLQTYPGREVPNPLSIEIVRGEANINVVMNDVFALTKLNYNTCIFGDGVPVTLRFADSIGEILTAGPIQENLPPLPFRYYI
ncbi:hypothetical protein SAMN05216386_0123 [Nitrosospira briensis]|uniref:Piwi domain-containing protein n=1 Tax=Nitrosospira briensis TaxID=35799 RepID=A0A1I4XGM2_9PROT|nr:hypothetical protein [Nitrosospira briensis]SFN25058.1 hypothetical protein SAMN05216386_0123 [Nitrosospira briensis]